MDLASSHGGFAGPTLIEKIQDEADKAFGYREELAGRDGVENPADPHAFGIAEGVLVGFLRALAILRSSSEASEWTECQERHGIIASGGTVPRSVPTAVVIDRTMNEGRVASRSGVGRPKVNKRDKYIAKFKELGLSMDLDSLSDTEVEAIARDCGIKI